MADSKNLKKKEEFAKLRGLWVEKALADCKLSDGAYRTLSCLAHCFLSSDKGTCWPSQETIATKRNVSLRTVNLHVSELKRRGHLGVVDRGRDMSNLYYPILDDTQKFAYYDAQGSAYQRAVKIRKKMPDAAQISVAKIRKNLRTNTLNEPFEEYIEGGGAYAPSAKSKQFNILYNANSSVNDAESTASDRGLDGRSVASTTLNHEEYFDDHFLADHDFGEPPVELNVPSITYYDGPDEADDLIVEPDQEAKRHSSGGEVDRCHIYENSCEETMVNCADANAIIVTHGFAESYFEDYLSSYLPAVAVDRMMDFLRAGKLTAGMVRSAIASQRESKNGNQKTA